MRPPDFVIGDASNPYLYRWHLLPKNRWLNVYLHRFLRDDDDRALHDHPWPFVSVVLNGTYREILRDDMRCRRCGNDTWRDDGRVPPPATCPNCGETQKIVGPWRRRFSVVFRRPEHRHRVELQRDAVAGHPVPCWTLMLVGPRVREWGFWCPQGFVHWKLFTRPGKPGEVGRGCE